MQDAPHPCVQLLLELWDDLNGVFAQHGSDTRCMERLCRCYKHTARNCGEAFRAVVPMLLPQVTTWYEQQPHSCFLYMNNVCLTSFGNGGRANELLPLFTDAYRRMSIATFKLLQASTLVDNP